MSSEMWPCHSGLGLGRRLIDSEYGDLTPFVPLSFDKERGKDILEEGLTPLLDTPRRGYFQARIGKEGASLFLDTPIISSEDKDSKRLKGTEGGNRQCPQRCGAPAGDWGWGDD